MPEPPPSDRQGLTPDDHDRLQREFTREDRERDEERREARERDQRRRDDEQRRRKQDELAQRARASRTSAQLEADAKDMELGADEAAREGSEYYLSVGAAFRADAATRREMIRARQQRLIAGALLTLAGLGLMFGGLGAGGQPAGETKASAAPTAGATAPPTATVAVPGNRPPRAGAIVAVLQAPNTTYAVEATDEDGDTLTYRWDSTSKCDSFTANGRVAVWRHNHPPCAENEPFHPGTISVVIGDGRGGETRREYTGGSNSGAGPVPTAPPATATPAPTPFPTTTSRPATTAPATASPAAGGTTGGPNVPLTGAGLLLLGGGVVLVGSGWRMPGGVAAPPQPQAPADPCAKEKAAEAAARARLDRAQAERDRLGALADNARRAADRVQETERAAEEARRGASYGEVDGVRHYTNKEKAAQIAAADAAAAAAREAAAQAQAAYDAAGGAKALDDAGWELYRANRDWEQANEALQRCLQINAPPPPPPTTGGTTTGGTTSGGTLAGGPSIATDPGTSTRTRERTCVDGEVKAGSERVTTREFNFAEIHRAEISLDAIYPGAQYVQIDEFIEWMEFTRQAFKAGKAIKGLAGGELVEGTLDTIDYSGIADVPDFLTFWDKMSEAVLRGLRQTTTIFIDRFSKLGDYSLRYTRRTYTARCRTWEQCEGGTWVRKHSFTFENTDTRRGMVEGPISVHDRSEIGPTIDRLFTRLQRSNQTATRGMEAFERSCGQ